MTKVRVKATQCSLDIPRIATIEKCKDEIEIWTTVSGSPDTAQDHFGCVAHSPSHFSEKLALGYLSWRAFGGIILAWPHATLAVVALVIAALLIGFGLVLLWSGRQIGKLADAA